MIVTREIQIDYGHTLPNHYSFCNQIHGHRGKIVAHFKGDVSQLDKSSEGMVIDFSICKKIMMEQIHEKLDHGFAIWNKSELDRVNFITEDKENEGWKKYLTVLDFIKARNTKVVELNEPPTAEVLAKWAFNNIRVALGNYLLEKNFPVMMILVEKIEWYETPNNCAVYSDADYIKDTQVIADATSIGFVDLYKDSFYDGTGKSPFTKDIKPM